MRIACIFAATVMAGAAHAQSVTTEPELQGAIRSGRLATIAPLCNLRDQAWAEDLRKSAIQDATRSPSPREQALKDAPDSDLVIGALGYAETEALEDFAQTSPEVACKKLARGSDLEAADQRVALYRRDLKRTEPIW